SDGSSETAASEAIFPEYETKNVSISEFNMALTAVEAQQITERWLAESRVARDTAVFALPPSQTPLGAGDVISLAEPGGQATFRLDQVEITDQRLIQAVRIEDAVYDPIDMDEQRVITQQYTNAGPVFPLFLDLPLMTGDEVPHAPHIAVTANPWPGSAAIYSSMTDNNYALNKIMPIAAAIGVTQDPLAAAAPGIVDYGPVLEVDFTQGSLSSLSHASMLAGGNLAAIGDGTPDNWEVIQFEVANIVGPSTYQISNRLRGQLGTDALMPNAWPAGSYFVLLDGTPQQIDMASNARTIGQHFLIGPASRPFTDASYIAENHAFDGNGLRPYAPVALTVMQQGGDRAFSWIRRDRLHADLWDQLDVPMSEAQEQYHVQILQSGNVIRDLFTNSPNWTYTAAQIAADNLVGAAEVRVAQVSSTYGPGLYRHQQFLI
ncbi:MAG: phage tail protein, partial [Planktomarina sp.]